MAEVSEKTNLHYVRKDGREVDPVVALRDLADEIDIHRDRLIKVGVVNLRAYVVAELNAASVALRGHLRGDL